MNKELEYLEYWYRVFFKCRVEHKSFPKNYKCYIFANGNDMREYCKKNNIKCVPYVYSYYDYFLLNEKDFGNLIGQRINEVILVSSEVEWLVDEICNNSIKKGYDLKYSKEN